MLSYTKSEGINWGEPSGKKWCPRDSGPRGFRGLLILVWTDPF
jgi:hypothetical protein